MNKIIFKIGFLFTIIISFFGILSCSMSYNLDCLDEYFIGYNNKNAFIGSVSYNLDTTDIYLPSEYKGVRVEKLGGYYGRGVPTPFFLEYTGIQYGFVTQLHEIDENDTIIETKINIYLPKWLKECIYINQYVSGICENEHNTIYIARCNYYIDSNNAYFYTKEGKLYNKSDDTLVDKLIYQDNIEN